MTASPNNITITKEGVQVTICTHRVEQIFNKALTMITLPTTPQNQDIDTGSKDTKFVDLLMKAEKRFSVDGKVSTGVGTAGTGDTHSDAYDKKEDLKKMFYAGGVMTLNWEGVDYTVNMDKLTTTWEANDRAVVIGGVITPIITSYTVKFTAIEGEDL